MPRPFEKGNTIGFTKDNPRAGPGRPKKKINRIDALLAKAEPLTAEELKEFRTCVFEEAKKGNHSYAKILADRFIPKTFNLALGKVPLKTVTDVSEAMSTLSNKAANSEVYVEDAKELMNLYDTTGRFIRDTTLDEIKTGLVDVKQELSCGFSSGT